VFGQFAQPVDRRHREGVVDGLAAQLKQSCLVGCVVVRVDVWKIGVPVKQIAEALGTVRGFQAVGNGLHGRQRVIVH
jgi:hypothetical protein